MDYMVMADDGKEYGPGSADSLRTWREEGRIHDLTRIRTISNNTVGPLSSIIGPKPTAAPSPPPTVNYSANPYQIPQTPQLHRPAAQAQPVQKHSEGAGVLGYVIL